MSTPTPGPGATAPTPSSADNFPTPFLHDGAPDLAGFDRPLLGWPLIGLPYRAEPPAGVTPQADSYCADLHAQLVGLLAAGRDADAGSAAPAASAEAIQEALKVLQQRPVVPLAYGGRVVQRSVAHVRQDLLLQLRETSADGKPQRLGAADNAAVDLLALLLDEIGRPISPDDPAQALLVKLQVPMLRVALSDPGFFAHRLHPARLFLGAVAEYALFSAGDDIETRAAIEMLGLLVDHAVKEYKGRSAVFDDLLNEFVAQHAAATRRGEAAERRQVEAAKGRDRLSMARNAAALAIDQRLRTGSPSPFLRALLEHAWSQVLALTILRDGEHSAMYQSRLAVAERLLEAFGGDDSEDRAPIDLTEEGFLRREIEIGLSKLGYPTGQSQLVVEQLFGGDGDDAEDDPTLISRSKSEPEERDTAPPDASESERKARTAREMAISKRIRALPSGAWLELVRDSQGQTVRRKLAWLSDDGKRCLLLDRRGAKSDEMSLARLAREIAGGRARVIPISTDTLVDRAMHAVSAQLRAKGSPGR